MTDVLVSTYANKHKVIMAQDYSLCLARPQLSGPGNQA